MMCIGTYLWATAISLLAATFILHMYDRKYVLDLKKRSSRYELFEIRDALVLLIAQGKMTEEDPAWKYVYRSVNRLLDLRNEMNIRDFFLQYSRFTFLLQRDENARKRLDEVRGEIRRSIESCAEFGETEQKVDRALQAMVMHQTSAWHFWTLAAFIATRIVCEAAFKVVRRARRPRSCRTCRSTLIKSLFTVACIQSQVRLRRSSLNWEGRWPITPRMRGSIHDRFDPR